MDVLPLKVLWHAEHMNNKHLLQVWSCLTGSMNYHEKKLFELAKSIKLMETVQNYLPVFPSPILQEMFKQTTFNKIKSLDLEEIFYYTDLFLGYLKTQLIIQIHSN